MGEERPKRPGVESPAEQAIREAIEAGEFDRLEGKGKPLPDLDQPYDELWWVKKKVREERVSVLPETLSIRGEVERALAGIDAMRSEADVRRSLEALDARIRKVNATASAGPGSGVAPLDVEAAIRRWRTRRD